MTTQDHRYPCEECDWIGPDASGLRADVRALHRAAHDIGRALLGAATPVLQPLVDALAWLTPGRGR